MKKLFGIFGFVLLFTTLAFRLFAGSVTISWDPNSEADLAGYKIHYGTQSRNYAQIIDVGNTTSHSVTELTDGSTYYFAVTAYDTANNESDFSEEVFITLALPEQPPTIVYFQPIDPRTLRLIFSKKMDSQSVKIISNYTITPTIQISSIEIDTSLTVVTLHTADHEIGKSYTLSVQGVKDINGTSLEGNYSTTYSFQDETPPHLERISLLNTEFIQLYFNEPMDASTVSNKQNYSISPTVSVLSIELDSNEKVVTLHTTPHSYEVEYTLTIHGIADVSGNLITEDWAINYIFTASPTVVYFHAVDPHTLHLVFSKKMDSQSVKIISNYTITPTIQISSIEIDTSLTVVTLHTANHEIGKTYTLSVQGVRDTDGTMLESSYSTTYFFPDQMPPYVKEISLLNLETIQLHFSERMNAATVNNTANYSISPPIAVHNAEIDSSEKVVTLHTATHSYEVKYTLIIHGVADTSGNLISENYTIPYIFAAPPTVVYFDVVDPQTLRLIFSKKMDSQSVKTISNYSITPTIQISTIEIDTSLTVVTLHTTKHEAAKTYTLRIQGVKDINGTTLRESYSTTYSLPDQRPPYVEKISLLNLEALQLHFSERMDASTVNNTANYSISPPISVLSTEVDSSIRIITLHTSPHLYEVKYGLTIRGVADTSGNLVPENYSIVYAFSAPPQVTDLNHPNYADSAVKVGEEYYVDRDFRISFIPEALKNLVWIKTANSDKFNTDSHFLTFSISKSATVYLGYDSRLTALPSWLESWQHTDLEIHDEEGVIFQIYSRDFAKGDVVLGGNYGTDATNMYIVLVKGNDEHIEYPEIPQDPYDTSEPAENYLLYQNFPNPFNPSTEIRFYLSEPDTVALTIHDMLGREVRRYEMQTNSAGIFSVSWDGTNEYGLPVASGIYLYCLQTKGHLRQTKKMIRVR